MNKILKVEFYDEFNCIADRCSFTCCEGWEIIVDSDTYDKWKSNEKKTGYFSKNVRTKRRNKETKYYIKMGLHKSCPFLDEKGLCDIVVNYGEEYLSKTCRMFPRQENSSGNLNEYSLSCACPAVVDLINNIEGKMKLLYDGDDSISVRKAMITILQNSKFPLKDRMLFLFHMLLSIKKELSNANDIFSKYQDENYLQTLADSWSGTRIKYKDSSQERNELFLDIVQNYREEKNYSYYLKDISELAEDLDTENSQTQWDNYKVVFGQYEKLIENCIVSKIFANCISNDIDEMIKSFQMVITEYIMVEYSAFLIWLVNEKKEIDYNNIRDYIVIYSRIIGYNVDGFREFWEDSFDDGVWEFVYILLLIN